MTVQLSSIINANIKVYAGVSNVRMCLYVYLRANVRACACVCI